MIESATKSPLQSGGLTVPRHDTYPLDDYGYEKYEENEYPLAYLITIRTYGTWLHGDAWHSVDRHWINCFGTPDMPPYQKLKVAMAEELKHPPVIFNDPQREVADQAIRDLCKRKSYTLHALNVRTNHAHAVVTAARKPERLADALKAAATRKLRKAQMFEPEVQIWSRGRSRRYLWKPRQLEAAIVYVIYGQGDEPFVMPE
jgi:REP element-mobilizing transposase RayT